MITPEQREEWRREHTGSGRGLCLGHYPLFGVQWPCPTIQLLDALELAERRLDELKALRND